MEHAGRHHGSFAVLVGAAVAGAAALAGCGGDGGGGGTSRSPPLVAPESPPAVRIQPTAVAESDEAGADALFQVTLTRSPDSPVTVGWSTLDATALAGEDYEPAQGTLVFGPDVIEDVILIRIIGDTLDEPDEEFAVVLQAAVGANIESGKAMATIMDDDDLPRLSIEGGKTTEGKGVMTFRVHLSESSRRTVQVRFETLSGTALEGSDFDAVSGTLTFDPGVVLQSILVPVANDRITEEDEDFFAFLSAPENAEIAAVMARALIEASDARPPPEEPDPPRPDPPNRDDDGAGDDDDGDDEDDDAGDDDADEDEDVEEPREPREPKEPKEKKEKKEKEKKDRKGDEDLEGDLEDAAEEDGGDGEVVADAGILL